MINGKRVLAVLFIILNLASFAPNIYRSYVKVSKLEKELAELKKTEISIEEQIEKYNQEIESLKEISTKEKIVRNKLQMVKPGEIIYRVAE